MITDNLKNSDLLKSAKIAGIFDESRNATAWLEAENEIAVAGLVLVNVMHCFHIKI